MKKIIALSASTLTFLAVAHANAADIRSAPASYKDGPAAYVGVDWSGLYIGAHLGGAWGDLKSADLDNWGGPLNYKFGNNASGVFGGGQIGYNLQRGDFVFGVEADLGDMSLSHKQLETPSDPIDHAGSMVAGGFYADVTGRLGYSIDRALVYAKGGYAYYGGSIGVEDPSWSASVSKSGLNGWTAGGGIEYKLNASWSLKAEYLHFDFGNENLAMYIASVPRTVRYTGEFTVDTAKVGVNYFVSPAYEPLK